MKPASYRAHGAHWIADLFGIAAKKLCDEKEIERLLNAAARAAGATILSSHFHAFGHRLGVTGVVLLAESHMSIHTWPESGFAAADIFLCGETSPEAAMEVLRRGFLPSSVKLEVIKRSALAESQLLRAELDAAS